MRTHTCTIERYWKCVLAISINIVNFYFFIKYINKNIIMFLNILNVEYNYIFNYNYWK